METSPQQPPKYCEDWQIPTPEELTAILPDFEVLSKVAKGGMAVVYKALQQKLNRVVALKVIPPVSDLDKEFVRCFRREGCVLAQLNHSNIVQVHDFVASKHGHLCMVMEYVGGWTFRDVLDEKRKVSPAWAVTAMGQICRGLEYAHQKQIVHCDIKPANIFITEGGVVKIGDFGLAKLERQVRESTVLEEMGTPLYAAPEQFNLEMELDQRADIFSLGIMLYEMLIGKIPRGTVVPPSQLINGLHPNLDDVIFMAMEREPEERYGSVRDFFEALKIAGAEPLAVALNQEDYHPTDEEIARAATAPQDVEESSPRQEMVKPLPVSPMATPAPVTPAATPAPAPRPAVAAPGSVPVSGPVTSHATSPAPRPPVSRSVAASGSPAASGPTPPPAPAPTSAPVPPPVSAPRPAPQQLPTPQQDSASKVKGNPDRVEFSAT